MIRRVRVTANGAGTHQLFVDGQEVHAASATIRVQPLELTEVEIDLLILDAVFDGDAHVVIPDVTRDALIALGWTPPGAAQ